MFNQPPPTLGNQYHDDGLLQHYLRHALPLDALHEIEPELIAMGEAAGGELYALQRADRLNEPVHTPCDAWGNRVDHIAVTPLWHKVEPMAARSGLIAIPYERRLGEYSRVHQFALVYLFTASSDLYSCPLAMTDGAARTVSSCMDDAVKARALAHLTSRDPAQFWTSGQWMTESTGGSDVGLSETLARQDEQGRWRLYGRKWFTSAISSQMALTLARPEGNPVGGKGLALFYLEVRDAQGQLNHLSVNRLKDKLGTRKVPTAELTLDGALATPVMGLSEGIKHMAPMLNITRTWNSVSCVAYMRRALALARDYATRRSAFGSLLADKPLHRETLDGMQAEFEAAFHLTFHLVECLGRVEAGQGGEAEQAMLRFLTPIVKLTTAKQCVALCSEALECFGGAGYVEDTGLPALLRDAQVFPIWEGTTNVLALEAMRAARVGNVIYDLVTRMQALAAAVTVVELHAARDRALQVFMRTVHSLKHDDDQTRERSARRLALSLGRSLALLCSCAHAQAVANESDGASAIHSTQRFAAELN